MSVENTLLAPDNAALPTTQGDKASALRASATSGRSMPFTVEAANQKFEERRASLLRAWGHNFRDKYNREPAPWQGAEDDDPDGTTAMRHIAAGMAIFADETATFNGADWACFSGEAETEAKEKHRQAFVHKVEQYFDQQVAAYTEIGTELAEKKGPYRTNGDYDFRLRDIIALIHIFLDKPKILTNEMIRKLICHDQVTFSPLGDTFTVTGSVPFAGQNLDEWLAEGRGGRHFFEEPVVGGVSVRISTPETENHMLGIYSWRFLVNEYLTYVASLSPQNDPFERFEPRLRALVESDPERYRNGPGIFDWVLQLLGRVPHSGMYESNAKPYGAIAISPILAFYQAADRLFPDDPERQKIKTAAQNALDYLAAEFAFQSFEGKRMAPFRRNAEKEAYVSFYGSDYVPHIFGALTGAYVFSDGEGGPYDSNNVDQAAAFALWSVLSGYRVPHAIHDWMLNKHGGYFARIQTRYSTDSYPMNRGVIPPEGTPDFARPRYFQAVSSGQVPFETYDVPGSGGFRPVTQLYFATRSYLNSAGGHPNAYYGTIEVSLAETAALMTVLGGALTAILGLPLTLPALLLTPLIRNKLNDILREKTEKIRGSDVKSRPSVLITAGDLRIDGDKDIASLERAMPAMRGQDDYWASKNLTTYKSFSLGYTFNPNDSRHLEWPQRYPEAWKDFLVERFGIGRAALLVFDFTAQPEHPLAGHYWVLAQFSKSENKGQFRHYGRGFWEVVPGHRFPDAGALAAHIRETNPAQHFDNDEDHHYTYRLASTGERVVIHNRFGSTATDQAILDIRTPDETAIPLNRYTADMRDESGLRQLPLLDVWQVDRDYNFTGIKYANGDGHGRVVIHNPFVGETLMLDSSDYRAPNRSTNTAAFITAQLPAIDGTQGQIPGVGALAPAGDVIYATHYTIPKPWQPSTQPGELVALDRHTLAPINRVTVGQAPVAIAVHHATQRVYVVNYQDHSLSVIDGGSFTVLDTLVFQGWGEHSVAVSQKYHRIFVTQAGQKRMLVIDGQTRSQLAAMNNLPIVGNVVVDEATDRLYVAVTNAANVQQQDVVEFEISAEGQHELRRTTVDGQVSRPSEMALDAERLYVITNRRQPNMVTNQQLTVLDRRTLGVTNIVSLRTGGGLGVAASASQNIVYVSTLANIQVLDARTLEVIRTIPVNAGQVKGEVAIDERTGFAYFGGSGSSKLTLSGPAPVALGQ